MGLFFGFGRENFGIDVDIFWYLIVGFWPGQLGFTDCRVEFLVLTNFVGSWDSSLWIIYCVLNLWDWFSIVLDGLIWVFVMYFSKYFFGFGRVNLGLRIIGFYFWTYWVVLGHDRWLVGFGEYIYCDLDLCVVLVFGIGWDRFWNTITTNPKLNYF